MERTAEPAALVRGLAATLERAQAVAGKLSPEQAIAPPEPGAWSANEILWHIRATADVHGRHISRILNEDEPRWTHVSPRAQMKKVRYNELPFLESLAAFERQRSELIAQLSGIAAEAWQRIALVRVAHRPGKPIWRLKLQDLVWGMVDHEQGHCREMQEVAAVLSPTV